MCRFITIIAPQSCNEQATAILKHHRSYVCETHNKDLAKAGPSKSIQLISPHAGCDCSTILDAPWQGERGTFDEGSLAEKMRRKGWSEAKIERALADKKHGLATTTHRGPSDSFELWQLIITDLLEGCASAGPIGIILHEYQGDMDSQPMSPSIRRIPANLSILDALRSLKEAELLLFDRAWLRAQAA